MTEPEFEAFLRHPEGTHGESGPGARPMNPNSVREIRDQCLRVGVPFFFKQWGGPMKSRTSRVLDGRTWDEMPQECQPAVPLLPVLALSPA